MDRFSGSDLVARSGRLGKPMRSFGGQADRPTAIPFRNAAINRRSLERKRPPTERRVERAEKAKVITALNEVFKDTGAVVVARYTGLTVAAMTAFRARMREAGGTVRVAKNRLAQRALEGTDVSHLKGLLKGQTVIAFSHDPVAAPKVAVEFAKGNDKLVILGGAMGTTNLDQNGVKALAALPSIEVLRARLVGLIASPATRVAQVLAAPAGQLARVVNAYAEKGNAG
jgi:large subunit ribosomal protein L10